MYAVILCFDQQVEAAVRAIWRELADKQISDYAAQVRERKPHITLASFDGLENVSDLVLDLEQFCKEISRFAVTFSSVGSFLRSGTVYLSPVLSSELYQCHARVYERLTVSADSLYSPGKWIPHMTLANYLAEDELPAAFALCQNQAQLEGRAVEIQLIKIQKDKQVQVVYQANFQE